MHRGRHATFCFMSKLKRSLLQCAVCPCDTATKDMIERNENTPTAKAAAGKHYTLLRNPRKAWKPPAGYSTEFTNRKDLRQTRYWQGSKEILR